MVGFLAPDFLWLSCLAFFCFPAQINGTNIVILELFSAFQMLLDRWDQILMSRVIFGGCDASFSGGCELGESAFRAVRCDDDPDS